MKILVVTSSYPPYGLSASALACRDAVRALMGRGHEVCVLTSSVGRTDDEADPTVRRILTTDLHWASARPARHLVRLLSRPPGDVSRRGRTARALYARFASYWLIRKELGNQSALQRVIHEFQPDVMYVWSLQAISVSLAFVAQAEGLPVVYYAADHWLAHWEEDPWYQIWRGEQPRPLLQDMGRAMVLPVLDAMDFVPRGELDVRTAHFASRHLKMTALKAGKAVAQAPIIPWGVDLARLPYRMSVTAPTRLLFVGALLPHKAPHTVIEALRILVHEYGCASVTLTLLGIGRNAAYLDDLTQRIASYGLEYHVQMMAPPAPERMPAVYQAHDVLCVPSVWEEPFAITLLEAMASGLPVVTTATGANADFVHPGVTGLVFPRENATALARHVFTLLADRDTYELVRSAARRTVEEHFRLEQSAAAVERLLQDAVAGSRRARRAGRSA